MILVFSDGAADGGRVTLTEAVKRARAAKIPIFTSLVGTDAGVVSVRTAGAAISSASRCLRTPSRSSRWRRRRAGATSRTPTDADLARVYADLKSRLGHTNKNEEITFAFAAAGALLLVGGCALSALWFRRIP